MPISNREKQARFREKEQLKEHIGQVLSHFQYMATSKFHLRRTLRDLERRLNHAIELPSGWTEEDLDLALKRVEEIQMDVFGLVGDPVAADVDAARDSVDPFMATSNPRKWKRDTEQAANEAIGLSEHLVSALELSRLPNEVRAAAMLEAARHVGRSLAHSAPIGESDATVVCLATLAPHYRRPDWLVDHLATWLRSRLDDETRKALGARLSEDDRGSVR